MTYEQVVQTAINRGLSQERADNLAMSLYLQGALDKDVLIESAIRDELNKQNKQ